MTTELYTGENPDNKSTKKLPEGSKAEKIRNGVEMRLAEITTIIAEGRPSLTRLELKEVGQNIIALFDEILDELPEDMRNEPEVSVRTVSIGELSQDATLIGDNRSKRFWEIDSEIEVLSKKFEELYERQTKEPEVHTDGFVVHPEKPLIH